MPPTIPTSARWPTLLLLAFLSLSFFLSGCSLLPGNKKEPEATEASQSTPAGQPAFTLEVHAPDDVRKLLLAHLELQRYRDLPDLQPNELSRLLVAADANARDLLGTLGYFSPDITIESKERVVEITVQPGPQTTVTGTQFHFDHAPADFARTQARLERNWPLAPGDAFTQQAWDNAKTQGLRRLQERRYPTAQLTASRADVNADTHSAALSVTYDPGPAYRFGALSVQGSERYDPDGARRIAQLPTGAVYSESELLDAQQRLASSGYYDAVFLNLDTEHASHQDLYAIAPVIAQVREAKLQKWVFGVGLSTDSGARLTVDHIHNRLPWLGWRAVTKLSVDTQAKLLSTEWTSLPNETGWRKFGAGQIKRETTGDYEVNSAQLRGGITKTTTHFDRSYYLQYDAATAQGTGAPPVSTAITANWGWTGRYFNNNTNPTRGHGLGFELGVGTTLHGQYEPFVRTRARWQAFIPLGKVALTGDAGKTIQRNARLVLRAEGGAVLAKQSAQVPVTQLFMTGGDTTVRGYGYRSIGATTYNDTLYGGRYLAVGSVEYQRPIVLRGNATDFDQAYFIDAGTVSNQLSGLSPQVGIGTGLRWRSPVGPMQVDLAYGVQAKRLRLHLRMGFTF